VDAANALWNVPLVADSNELVRVLWNNGAQFNTLVGILQSIVGFSYTDAYVTVRSLLGF
jgi:hypothetical protein